MAEDYYCRNCKNIFQPINWMYPPGYNDSAESGRAVCPICGSTATEPDKDPVERLTDEERIEIAKEDIRKMNENIVETLLKTDKCPACGDFLDEERPGYWHCKRCDFARWDIDDTHPIMRYGRKE